MGTRHKQSVIDKDGKLRIAQYGQWDGRPEHQGTDILNYLKTGDLEKYQAALQKISKITKKESKIVSNEGTNWINEYPYLSRDCGAKIHKMIEEGKVKFVDFISNKEARLWCEGFYTINFKRGVFISEFHGVKKTFKLDNLPTVEEYLKAMEV